MSIAQETIAVNNAYFTAMNARANAAVSCGQLQAIGTQVTASVNGTLSAITSELNEVNQQAVNLYNDIQNLAAHIATLTGTQTSLTQVSAAAATAAAVSDLGSVIAYCKLQGLSLAI